VSQRVFGLGHQLPPAMIEFFQCTGVLMQGYQVTNTPFWQHHPVACSFVAILNVYANSLGPNNDGFDPEACNYVLADGVTFNTGDDCIAIKSGKDTDTEFGPAQNHLIANCTMNSGHGGITIGSEMSAGAQNIFAENLQMLNQNYATNPLNIAIRVKTNLNRGGTVQNVHVRNVSLPNGVNLTPSFYKPLPGSPIPSGTVSTNQGGIVTFDCDYSPGSDNVRTRPPVVTNVTIDNLTASAPPGASASCYQAIIIQGPVASDYDGLTTPPPPVTPVENVTISNSNFGMPADASQPIYLYNVQNLVLNDVVIGGTTYNTTLSA
jgi:polygalacturonase